jgi:RimJ/RimL family protein N-acetyltransferase
MRIKNGMQLTIRPAAVGDAEGIVAYLNQIGGESDNLTYGENEFRFTVEQERLFLLNLQDKKTSVLLLGLLGEEIVSIGNIMGEEKARLAHNASLGISVAKAYWHQGIGTLMMQELVRFAEAVGIRNLFLKVRSDNTHAVRLYEKFGFTTIALIPEEMLINGKYCDNLLMLKRFKPKS